MRIRKVRNGVSNKNHQISLNILGGLPMNYVAVQV